MRVAIFTLALVGAIACTTNPDDPISAGDGPFFTRSGGSFDKLAFTPADGAAVIDTGAALSDAHKATGVKSRLRAFVLDTDTVCGKGARRPNMTVFAIDALSDQPSFVAGTYTQKLDSVPGHVDLSMTKLNATCSSDMQDYGIESGTVTIAQVTATFVEGSFDVTFMNGAGTLTGTFNVPLCASLDSSACTP